MGAAGFEPATAWSEAKHSIQTELSALFNRIAGWRLSPTILRSNYC